MQARIVIDLEVSNRTVIEDIVQHLKTMLPYMADDMLVTSKVLGQPIDPRQRAALFATFSDVFGHNEDDARYAFTRFVLGKRPDEAVSWSSGADCAITADEASKVLDALDTLNV